MSEGFFFYFFFNFIGYTDDENDNLLSALMKSIENLGDEWSHPTMFLQAPIDSNKSREHSKGSEWHLQWIFHVIHLTKDDM